MPSPDWYVCPVVIPYYGGKYELSRVLVPLIAPHSRYIEVFAGGLSMFFRKNKVKWNVLNDKDNDIVNLYICVIEKKDELIEKLFWLPKSRELFLNFREELSDYRIKIPDPYRAAKYIYCIRHSFNKMIHTPFSKNRDMNKKWEDEITYSRKFLAGATIENLDFEELFTKYPPQEGDFWYLDPPYFIATDKGDYYRNNFSNSDHIRLKSHIDMINDAGANFMLSYDYRPEVEKLYNKYYIKTLDLKYSGATKEHRDKKRKEYLILNYKPKTQINIFN